MCSTMFRNPGFVDCEKWTEFSTTHYDFAAFKLLGKKEGAKLAVFWGEERIRMKDFDSTVISDYLISLVRCSKDYFDVNGEYLNSVNPELLVIDTHNNYVLHASALFSAVPDAPTEVASYFWGFTSGFCQTHGRHPSDLSGRSQMGNDFHEALEVHLYKNLLLACCAYVCWGRKLLLRSNYWSPHFYAEMTDIVTRYTAFAGPIADVLTPPCSRR